MFACTWHSGWRAGNVAQHSERGYKTHPICCHQVLQILTKKQQHFDATPYLIIYDGFIMLL